MSNEYIIREAEIESKERSKSPRIWSAFGKNS